MRELLLFALLCQLTRGELESTNRFFAKPGKIMIGFIDSYTTSSSTRNQMQNILTFQYTVEKYGESLLDGELDIGYAMLLTRSNDIVNEMIEMLTKYPNIIAIIGPRISGYVLSVSSLVSALRIPTFVYGSSVLSDYVLESLNWRDVLPLTATATGQASTMLPSILTELGADIVTVLYEDSDYAAPQYPVLLKSLKNLHIDTPRSVLLNKNDDLGILKGKLTGVLEDMEGAKKNNRTSVIVSLMSSKVLRPVLEWFVDNANSDSLDTLIVTSSQGCVLEVQDSWTERGLGVLKACQTYVSIAELERYFQDEAVLWVGEEEYNPLLTERVELAGCDVGNNTCFSELLLAMTSSVRPYSAYNHRIYYALRAFLQALQSSDVDGDLLRAYAARTDGMEPMNSELADTLLGLFKIKSDNFDSGLHFGVNQTRSAPYLDISLIFNHTTFLWSEKDASNQNVKDYKKYISDNLLEGSRLKCSVDCLPGYYMYQDPTQRAQNCWLCGICEENSYSNTRNAKSCEDCISGTWAARNKTTCTSDTTSLHLVDTPYGNAILSIVLIAGLFIVVTFAFYIALWESSVVVASGRDLATFMFPGMMCGVLDAALISSPPGVKMCIGVQVVSHLFVMLVIPPLFVRTLRIVVVFRFSIKNKKIVQYVTKNYVYVHMIAVMAPIIFSLAYSLALSDYRFTVTMTEESYIDGVFTVTASCTPNNFDLVYFLISYIIAVLFIAAVMGFFTRKLPDNYKESLHIFMCSLVTLLLVLCYVPAMILIPGQKQVFSLAVIVAILAVMVNATIFLPKIYVCMRYPELRKRKPRSTRRSRGGSSYASKGDPSKLSHNDTKPDLLTP